ncbi:hypothetical protein D9619_000050 [Psilocybe cf. subviscida]|uniref:Uncharacterized protein n=1 Tax=Psilocybe cf. subviscida TaxID=2480587 RepID=A0A8H5BGM5_9AGAR|nr:hypothetical protein D9619_000050 [Psilocybe cf. subviscida]
MSASLYSASDPHHAPPYSDRNFATNIREPAYILLAKLHSRTQLSTPTDFMNYTALFERLHPAYDDDDHIDRIQILGTYASAFTPGLWTRILNQLQLTRLNTFERMHLDIAIILSAALRVFIQKDKESIPESEFLQAVYVHDYLYPIHIRSTYSEPRYLDPVLTHFVRTSRYSQTALDPTQLSSINNSSLSVSPDRLESRSPSAHARPAGGMLPLPYILENRSSQSSDVATGPSPPCTVAVSSPSHEKREGIDIISAKDPAITSTMAISSSSPPRHSLHNLSLGTITSSEASSPVPPFVPPDPPAAKSLPSITAGPTPASTVSIIKNSSALAADPFALNSHSNSFTLLHVYIKRHSLHHSLIPTLIGQPYLHGISPSSSILLPQSPSVCRADPSKNRAPDGDYNSTASPTRKRKVRSQVLSPSAKYDKMRSASFQITGLEGAQKGELKMSLGP